MRSHWLRSRLLLGPSCPGLYRAPAWTLISSAPRRKILPVPGHRRLHHLAERWLEVHFIMPVALQHDELLRLPGASVQLSGILRRDQPIIVGRNEKDRPGRDLVNHPFRIELD